MEEWATWTSILDQLDRYDMLEFRLHYADSLFFEAVRLEQFGYTTKARHCYVLWEQEMRRMDEATLPYT